MSFVERKITFAGDEPVHLSIHMFLLICCLFKQTSNWYMFYMNAFQVRILINVYVPCHGHWGPLVTTVTPGPTLDPDGTGVHGPAPVPTYYAMEIYIGATSVADGHPRVVVGVAESCCRDTLYTRSHDYSGVWRIRRQHCYRSACQTQGDLFKTRFYIILSCENSPEGSYRILELSSDCNWLVHRYHHIDNIYHA